MSYAIIKLEKPLLSEDEARTYIEAHNWQFARTMRHNPHWYIARRMVDDHEAFNDLIRFIHWNGVPMRWGRQGIRPYLELDGFHYWTMVAEPHWVEVINRAEIEGSKAVAVDGNPRFEGVKDSPNIEYFR